jgi:hypothetical protein
MDLTQSWSDQDFNGRWSAQGDQSIESAYTNGIAALTQIPGYAADS